MLGQPALLEHFASRRLQVLAVRTVCDLVLGKMDKTCEMKRTTLDSPLGKLELSGCEQGLHKISFLGQGTPAAERLRSVAGQPCPPARAKSPRCLVNMQFSQHLPRRSNSAMEVPAPAEVLRGPEPLKQCAAWLNAYFQQPEAIEELPVPALHHPVFQQESFTRQVLWELLKAVKFGEVVSYQQLAALAGNPKAARAVGGAMRSNPDVPVTLLHSVKIDAKNGHSSPPPAFPMSSSEASSAASLVHVSMVTQTLVKSGPTA
uniref:Methylated-DNA--protein-cysteine methyltransferase n=1 Tax=Callithrix jacchus TaxID=9483 RepID=A0A8I3ZZH5_CALJA